jgi:hypothetical protein
MIGLVELMKLSNVGGGVVGVMERSFGWKL